MPKHTRDARVESVSKCCRQSLQGISPADTCIMANGPANYHSLDIPGVPILFQCLGLLACLHALAMLSV